MNTPNHHNLSITFWNICGLGSKLTNPDFMEFLKNDIIFLSETWSRSSTHVDPFQNYTIIHKHRKDNDANHIRGAGGLAALIKNNINKAVSELPSQSDNIMWIKLNKKLFGLGKDLYIAFVYISPQSSTVNPIHKKQVFEILQNELIQLPRDCDILVGGDFNARLGQINDFILNDDDQHVDLPHTYLPDYEVMCRKSQDDTINQYSRHLISLCTSNQLRILNGRLPGDEEGACTYFGQNGSSLLDFVLASEQLYLQTPAILKLLKIDKDALLFSDHCSVNLYLSITKSKTKNINPNILIEDRPSRYIWCNSKISEYAQQFDSITCEKNLKCLSEKTLSSKEDVDEMINHINMMLKSSAEGIFQKKSLRKNKHFRRFKSPWYTKSCSSIKSQLNNTARLLKSHPNDPFLRGRVCRLRKLYKKEIKLSKKRYNSAALHELNDAMYNNKNKFWKLLNSFKNNKDGESSILPDSLDLYNHFKNLHEVDADVADEFNITSNIAPNQKSSKQSIEKLNKSIEDDEIMGALKYLKLKKSPGKDGLLAEMIHLTAHKFLSIYKNLFNQIFKSGYFPLSWKKSLILPLHKSGDKLNSSNYRGISLTSILGKLFCLILNERLKNFLSSNDIIHKSQAGFQENKQTADHLFCLKTLISKYTKNNQKLFTCFIDLRKAFDTVWHPGLLSKLQNLSINGPFYNMIKSLYSDNAAQIIYKSQLTKSINPSIGVRQGCIISPSLFNVYINDLANSLTCPSTDPVFLVDTPLNCLMFADDIILISRSEKGLQKCLEKTSDYCKTWKLKVNHDKSKCLVFSKQITHENPQFFIDDTVLETVENYKYLGFSFHRSCKQTFGIDELCSKAEKAWIITRRFMRRSPTSYVAIHKTLYQSAILPIILYGSGIWGDSISHEENNLIENLQKKIMCQILNVRRNISGTALKGELAFYPLQINVKVNMIKYLLRLITCDQNSLIHKAFGEQLLSTSKNSWLTSVKKHLLEVDINVELLLQKDIKSNFNKKRLINVIKSQLHDQYTSQFEKNNLNNQIPSLSHQLLFYKKIKNKFEFENYLLLPNKKTRTAITKLRVSAHRLGVQTGRYCGIPYEERKCIFCKNDSMDDEIHLLFNCSMNSCLRTEMFDCMESMCRNFATKTDEQKLDFMFTQPSPAINRLLGTFICRSFEQREDNILSI